MTNITPTPPRLGERSEEPSEKIFRVFSIGNNGGIPGLPSYSRNYIEFLICMTLSSIDSSIT